MSSLNYYVKRQFDWLDTVTGPLQWFQHTQWLGHYSGSSRHSDWATTVVSADAVTGPLQWFQQTQWLGHYSGSSRHSDWATPVVPAIKSSGKIRLRRFWANSWWLRYLSRRQKTFYKKRWVVGGTPSWFNLPKSLGSKLPLNPLKTFQFTHLSYDTSTAPAIYHGQNFKQ